MMGQLDDPRGRKGVVIGVTSLVIGIVLGVIAIKVADSGKAEGLKPVPGEASAPAPNARTEGWSRVTDRPGVFGHGDLEQVTSVVAIGDEFFAVGSHNYKPAIWRASDPSVWQRLTRVEPGEGDRPSIVWAVAEHNGTYVAVGKESDHAAVWTSSDGQTWRLVDRPAEVFGQPDQYSSMDAVLWLGDHWLAAGSFRAGGRDADVAATWSSDDAHAWTRVGESDSFGTIVGETPTITSLATDGKRIVAAGSIRSLVGSPRLRPALWTSTDGYTWSAVSLAAVGSDNDSASLPSVAVRNGRWVAVGNDGHDAMVFTSDNGVNWSRVKKPFDYVYSTEENAMNDVAPTITDWIAVGSSEDETRPRDARIWTSDDGFHWRQVYPDPAVFGGPDRQELDGVVATSDVAVAVGWDQSGGNARGAVWMSTGGSG